MPAPRIAIGGFMLEANGHSFATREEFAAHFVAAGDQLVADWKSAHPRAPLTLTGFVNAMVPPLRGKRYARRRARAAPSTTNSSSRC